MTDVRRYQLIAVLAAALALTVAFVRPQETNAPTNTNGANENGNVNTNAALNQNVNASTLDSLEFTMADLPDADSALRFRLRTVAGWAAELADDGRQVRFFDPTNDSATTLVVSTYDRSSFTAPANTVGDPVAMTLDGNAGQRYAVTDPEDMSRTGSVYDLRAADRPTTVTRFTFDPSVSTETVAEIMSTVRLTR